ncbi:hypothetical protein OIU77_018949 [Salix suchowensis]|uniref:Uncharacterized protein n=1 Tax=Salix suchowensis TaxID=1278906 RepID=A0ABQ9CGE5_9ROSI|nr:hypothetical protein OIU77_018949 [Salix suchowensis]
MVMVVVVMSLSRLCSRCSRVDQLFFFAETGSGGIPLVLLPHFPYF